MEKIKQLEKRIRNNLFTNDMLFNERAEENNHIAREIRELISIGTLDKTTDDRRYQIEILDFLDNKNL